ncbi:DUF445 domain-containing protein [Paenibacillus turpanensis]|uniref:DUF445 domain-containing protein n=1 Tax=Paenibacillus turpanensis TaxID=2689078 RepID=UPI00140D4AFE|nr:DUF445 family protein [Paenibacillus turpanensis]
MNFWIVPINIAVAALIGGVTNHLAIKMLFHPRQAVYLAGRKLPFTPGLIPKRRDEVAVALGKVVSEYLVTSQGLAQALEKPALRDAAAGKLRLLVEEWTAKEETLQELLLRFWPEERLAEERAKLLAFASGAAGRTLEWLWETYDLGGKTIADLIPDWQESRKEQLVTWAADSILQAVRSELMSPEGERLLRQLTGRFMEGAGGGFLGALAGMFMDESKIIGKVRAALDEAIASPQVRGTVTGFLYRKLDELEEGPIVEKLGEWLGVDVREWLEGKLQAAVQEGAWLDALAGRRIADLTGPFRNSLLERIPALVEGTFSLLARNMDKLMGAVRLPELVEEQVRAFPMEKLESIILDLSGKEFRAITWLGAVLGGLIGLLQSLFYAFY